MEMSIHLLLRFPCHCLGSDRATWLLAKPTLSADLNASIVPDVPQLGGQRADQHLIAEPEGGSFISRTVAHCRVDGQCA
jgi:hypothetical protein